MRDKTTETACAGNRRLAVPLQTVCAHLSRARECRELREDGDRSAFYFLYTTRDPHSRSLCSRRRSFTVGHALLDPRHEGFDEYLDAAFHYFKRHRRGVFRTE